MHSAWERLRDAEICHSDLATAQKEPRGPVMLILAMTWGPRPRDADHQRACCNGV